MKVLFVCNNVFVTGNGVSTSIRQTIKALKDAGLDVRLMCGENPNYEGPEPDYILKRFHFPIFQPIIDRNCFSFAVSDKKLIRQAVEWADIIHLAEAMPLEMDVLKVAEEMGKPSVATFHMFTQNIYYNIFKFIGEWKAGNHILMRIWRDKVFDRCSHIQCPTEVVKAYLERWHFKAELHTFSNGTVLDGPAKASNPGTSPYKILCIGRFAREKSQETLIKAMRYSRHSTEIQLHFAGKGAGLRKFERMCSELLEKGILKHPAIFGFYGSKKLMEISRDAYLYIHCANIEVEGLSCLEAMGQGAVPVIAEAPLAATSSFALCEQSRYKFGDSRALASRIDWWIEHPEERQRMSLEYAESARTHSLQNSAAKLIEMYNQAL